MPLLIKPTRRSSGATTRRKPVVGVVRVVLGREVDLRLASLLVAVPHGALDAFGIWRADLGGITRRVEDAADLHGLTAAARRP